MIYPPISSSSTGFNPFTRSIQHSLAPPLLYSIVFHETSTTNSLGLVSLSPLSVISPPLITINTQPAPALAPASPPFFFLFSAILVSNCSIFRSNSIFLPASPERVCSKKAILSAGVDSARALTSCYPDARAREK